MEGGPDAALTAETGGDEAGFRAKTRAQSPVTDFRLSHLSSSQ
jgi:hypothetical protein